MCKTRTKEDATVEISVVRPTACDWISVARRSKDGLEYFGTEYYTIDQARTLHEKLGKLLEVTE